MIFGLGPRSRGVHAALRGRILRGDLAVGDRVGPLPELAAAFAVAPGTVRQAIAHLAEEGLVEHRSRRGAFVRARTPPAVLIVDDDERYLDLLAAHVSHAGYRVVRARFPVEALVAMGGD